MRGIFLVGVVCALIAPLFFARADIANLQVKISERERQIAEVEKEIAAYQSELEKVGTEANTLTNAIAELDLTRKKLLAEIRATEGKIAAATLTIEALTEDIGAQEVRIEQGSAALGKTLRVLAASEEVSAPALLLGNEGFSGAWRTADALQTIQARLAERIREVKETKNALEDNRAAVEALRRKLSGLRAELADRKRIADGQRAEQQSFLNQTKNKEANYQKLLNDRVALRAAFEQEILEYELQLKFELDPTRLPQAGSGVLRWPLDAVKITQYFGNTPFARSGAYKGAGHNGVDFRAPVGTPVKAAQGGVVRGVGDTDQTCRGASYGKWVLVEHGNGLTTLYAHLSLVRAEAGQSVNTGEVLGYAGATGYATGPHLHFTVFATQGVEVRNYPSRVCGRNYTMPVANPGAYLNPLQYL